MRMRGGTELRCARCHGLALSKEVSAGSGEPRRAQSRLPGNKSLNDQQFTPTEIARWK